jgi:hypothetical protein
LSKDIEEIKYEEIYEIFQDIKSYQILLNDYFNFIQKMVAEMEKSTHKSHKQLQEEMEFFKTLKVFANRKRWWQFWR